MFPGNPWVWHQCLAKLRRPGVYHPPGKLLGLTIGASFQCGVLNPDRVVVTAQLGVFAFVWDHLIQSIFR